MNRLEGKVALITGGARGQGAVEAELFASEGAAVVVTDVLDELGEQVAASIDGATYRHLDVTSESDWQRVVDQVVADHGTIDVLVNNAGIDMVKKLLETSVDEFDRIVAINYRGTFLGMRTVAQVLVDAGRPGSIINISSVAGLEGLKNHAAYSSSKFAVTGLTKAAAKEWGPHGIRVNSVHPGFIETPMTEGMRPMTDPDLRKRVEHSIPLRRIGQSIDIATMVLFLASDESSYCTGQAFTVDGGVHR
jgi:3alpha(or 20beta)-hydroxysteroid dehydrogenase